MKKVLIAVLTGFCFSIASAQDTYIIVFHPGKSQKAENLKLNIREKRHLSSINGFSAKLTPRQLYGLQHNPNVKYINKDRTVKLSPQAASVVALSTQITPPGIVRIGATRHPKFGNTRGIGVGVIDTGIDPHIELNVVGRVDFSGEGGDFDGAGHGTHVAGIIGAINNDIGVVGVAPGVDLYSIKCLGSDGTGTYEGIIAGLDWATQNADKIAVVNMSLGGVGYLQSLHDAVKAAEAAGILVCVAAGNDGFRDIYGYDKVWGNGDDFTPSDLPEALTVSAMYDIDGYAGGAAGPGDDQMAGFSSFSTTVVPWNPVNSPGAGIDLAAPGMNILSTYKGNAIAILSGTSMATPHVTGMAALYMLLHGRAHNADEVHAVRQGLINEGQAQNQWLVGFTNDKDQNPEPLVYYGGGIPIPTNNHAPVLQPFVSDTTHMEVGATVTFPLVASDPDGDTLQYLIRTGDGVTASITGNTLTVTGVSDALTWVAVGVVDPYGAVNQKAGWFYVGHPDFPPYMITKFDNSVTVDPLGTLSLEVIHGDPNNDPSHIYLNPYDSTNIRISLIDNGPNVSSWVVITSLKNEVSINNQVPLCVEAANVWSCVWFYVNVNRLNNGLPTITPDPFPTVYVKAGETKTVPMNWSDPDGDHVSLNWGNNDAESGYPVNASFSIDTVRRMAVIKGIKPYSGGAYNDDRDLVWFDMRDGWGAYVYRQALIFVNPADSVPADTEAPRANITSPAAGAILSGIVTGMVSATDNIGVTGVAYFSGDTQLSEWLTVAPYSLTVDTRLYPNDTYPVHVRARDAAGNEGRSATVNFTIFNAPPLPVDTAGPVLNNIKIVVPKNGQASFSFNAADVSGVITMAIRFDNVSLGSCSNTTYCSKTYQSKNISAGVDHTVTFTATDGLGNQRTETRTMRK